MHTPYASKCFPHCTGCIMYKKDPQCEARTLPCSANACVSLDFMPCRPAQLKALSSVQNKHQFVVQNESPKGTSHMGVEHDYQQAVDRQRGLYIQSQADTRSQALESSSTSSPASLRCGHPSDWRGRLGLVIGVHPMQASTRAA